MPVTFYFVVASSIYVYIWKIKEGRVASLVNVMIQSFGLAITFVHGHASFPFLGAHHIYRIYCDRVVVEVLKSTAAGEPSHLHVEVTSHFQIHPQTGRISLASLEDVDGCCFAQILSYHIHKVNHMWPLDLKKMYNSVLIFSPNFAWKKQRKKPDRKKTHFICLLWSVQ